MLHDLKKKWLRNKLDRTKVKTVEKKELLELEREIKLAENIDYSEGEKRLEQEKKDKHNERADRLRKKGASVFKIIGDLAGNAFENIFQEEKPKKKKK